MTDEQLFEQSIRDLILELCDVLHRHGYHEVSVGALMRVMGIPHEQAQQHDTETFEIARNIHEFRQKSVVETPPPGTTFH